jgi:hypothetical protein
MIALLLFFHPKLLPFIECVVWLLPEMNAESSRSHLVIGIVIESTNKTTGTVTKGKVGVEHRQTILVDVFLNLPSFLSIHVASQSYGICIN